VTERKTLVYEEKGRREEKEKENGNENENKNEKDITNMDLK